MPNELILAARRVAGHIREAEEQTDRSIANKARMLADLIDARQLSGRRARFHGNIVDRTIEIITAEGELRRSTAQLHDDLAAINLRELAIGDVIDCPPKAHKLYAVEGAIDAA
jgi:hypothetical protein